MLENCTPNWPNTVMWLGLVAGVVACVFFMAKYVWGSTSNKNEDDDE